MTSRGCSTTPSRRSSPLAGLDPARAAAYAEVTELLRQLQHATNQAARRYLDGEIDAGAAAEYLTRYTLARPEFAPMSLKLPA